MTKRLRVALQTKCPYACDQSVSGRSEQGGGVGKSGGEGRMTLERGNRSMVRRWEPTGPRRPPKAHRHRPAARRPHPRSRQGIHRSHPRQNRKALPQRRLLGNRGSRRRPDGGCSFPSFPNFIWERLLFFAKFHFALTHACIIALRSAMKLPQQVRSQVQLGNEGTNVVLGLDHGWS